MKFINRVKEEMLRRRKNEISGIEEKIQELMQKQTEESENIEFLKQETDKKSKEKAQIQNRMISKQELADLEHIYELVVNFEAIKKITDIIKNETPIYNKYAFFDEVDIEEFKKEEKGRRQRLYEKIKNLNKQIEEILKETEKPKEQESKAEESTDTKPRKRKIFEIFKRKKTQEQVQEQEPIINQYRKTVKEFQKSYNRFLDIGVDEEDIIDKNSCISIVTTLKTILTMQKRGIELDKEQNEILEEMQPYELWEEMYKYYFNIREISEIVRAYAKKIDEYEKIYEKSPKLFEEQTLEQIFIENNQLLVDLKLKSKDATRKSNELTRGKQSGQEIKEQIKTLETKKKKIEEMCEKIRVAKTLKDLGLRNKEDAVRKLEIESKDYIIISIPKEIKQVKDLFQKDKQIKIEADGKIIYAIYSTNTATGKINSVEISKDINGALMIPITELKKEDIDNVREGKINLNASVLTKEGSFAILPEGKDIGLKKQKNYKNGTIEQQIQEFLGDDYTTEIEEMENYDIFKNIPNISSNEKRAKREAVKKALFENIKRNITHTDTILVNGKSFFISKDDEKEFEKQETLKTLDEKSLLQISSEIQEYLKNPEEKRGKIDSIYEKLVLEYMKTNKKAKAEYQDEANTQIEIKGKKISIKPYLPTGEKQIATKYSRSNEDVAYKTMKLANLVNRFAHMTEKEELQCSLYNAKLNLIERVIDLAEKNPNIKIKKQFDEDKMVKSVVLEVPNYNMIALHIKNQSQRLTAKFSRLEEMQGNILQTSAIAIPGVNKDFITEMKKMSVEERMRTLLELNSYTFYKLAIRMGYKTEDVETKESRKAFIKNMTSDEKLSELLNENEEIER